MPDKRKSMCKSSPPAPTVGMCCLVSSRNMREATVAGEQGAKGQIIIQEVKARVRFISFFKSWDEIWTLF